jgi:hypothetical protein
MLRPGRWWFTPVILATRRQRSGGLRFEASSFRWLADSQGLISGKNQHKNRAG